MNAETAAAVPPAVQLEGITKRFPGVVANHDICLTVEPGTVHAIVGENGAGKSTLMKSSLGIVPRSAGEVRAFGEPLSRQMHRLAYVPQRASVDWDFPTRVIDVVLMGMYRELGMFGRVRPQHREKAMACLDRVGMADYAARQIGQLSGGQQQRVFLARALAQSADLYLLDEPLAGVDAATEKAIIGVLKSLQAEGRTVICVHHDLSTVPDYFDRVLFINVRKIAEGPLETAFTPENLQLTYGGRLATAHINRLRTAV